MKAFLLILASAALMSASGELSGRRAPGFSLPDAHLQQRDIQDYRGKIVVLDIIQTTCPHCAKFSDILEKLHAKYGSKVAILSIVNPPDNQSTVGKFAAEHKITTPILFDCGQASVSYLKATPQNPSISVPHVFLIDPQGMIRKDYAYEFDTHNIFEGDGLDSEIDQLLAGGETPKAKKK
ncbi:MAG: TlpA disulfide reductase family protein [Bryobacteraceae bacterium]